MRRGTELWPGIVCCIKSRSNVRCDFGMVFVGVLLFLFVSLVIIVSYSRPASLIGNVIVERVPSQALLD